MNIIQNSCLKIEDNKLSYEKSFIQLSNISQAFVEKETKKSYSILASLGVNHANYVINLEECTITNSQIGEKNVMNAT